MPKTKPNIRNADSLTNEGEIRYDPSAKELVYHDDVGEKSVAVGGSSLGISNSVDYFPGAAGTVTIAHGIGTIPKIIHVTSHLNTSPGSGGRASIFLNTSGPDVGSYVSDVFDPTDTRVRVFSHVDSGASAGIEILVDNGVTLNRLRIDNPTSTDVDVTLSAAGGGITALRLQFIG